jgi:uncharacterized UPF0160 family protein
MASVLIDQTIGFTHWPQAKIIRPASKQAIQSRDTILDIGPHHASVGHRVDRLA